MVLHNTGMHKDDLYKEIAVWVLGACTNWNLTTNAFSLADFQFVLFMGRTNSVVLKYLEGKQKLDGTLSDLECDICMRAERIFGHLMCNSA